VDLGFAVESDLSSPQQKNPIDMGAMHGVKVVDFGQYIAGPLTARILCDEGAEVIRVDPPSGPSWVSPANAVLNRGKTCVQLDLKTAAGVESAKKLIESADIVIENFRPGVMKRLGLGPDDAKALNPEVVYLSMPGFASTDAELAEIKAFEGIILAGTGVFSDMGLNRILRGVNPSFSPLALASTYSSVMGAISASLALYSKDRYGEGDVIEVPLATGLMECLVYNSLEILDVPERYKCVREREIERREEENLPMNLSYAAISKLLDPFYCTYFCKDGRPFYIVAPCHEIHQQRTLEALGIWEDMLAKGLPLGDVYARSKDWEEDCVLGTYPIR
jgi:crotonobetainyl-CoA:carnitine CoA-transferase CaiB-like acyl-CoA transferase